MARFDQQKPCSYQSRVESVQRKQIPQGYWYPDNHLQD